MTSSCSFADSDGVPVDHDGSRLEDPVGFGENCGRFGVVDTVMLELLGSNPAFNGDVHHGESSPRFEHLLSPDGFRSPVSVDDLVDVQSVSSDHTLTPGEAVAAAAKAAENSTIFRAALQINSNEREASITANRRVLELQNFIISKGFSLADVTISAHSSGSGKPSSLVRDEFGLPSWNRPPRVANASELLFGNENKNSGRCPTAILENTGIVENILDSSPGEKTGKKSWANVVVQPSKQVNSELRFDYCPMPAGSKIITPPDEVLQKGIDKFKCCVVGTFTKGNLSFSKVSELAQRSWSLKGLCHVSQKSTTQFIFKFETESQCNTILAKGTWYFERKPMVISVWGNVIKPEPVKNIPLWLKLSQIPDYYWTREGLSFLASAVGKPLCADKLTSGLNPLPFAKMCVCYNLGDPLPDSLTVACLDPCTGEKSTTEVLISYPQRPLFCSACSSLGHSVSACPSVKRVWVKKQVASMDSAVIQPAGEGHKISGIVPEAPEGPADLLENNEEWQTVKRKGKEVCSPHDSPIIAESFKGLKNVDEIDVLKNLQHDQPVLSRNSQMLTKSQRKRLRRSLGKNSPPTN